MRVVSCALTLMDALEIASMGMTFTILTSVTKRLIIVKSRKLTNVFFASSLIIGKDGTGSFAPSAIKTVRYVTKTPLIVILVEMDFGLITRQRNAKTHGLKTLHVHHLRNVLR